MASRSIDVARAYVQGLERDRDHLRELEEQYDKRVWELIQIAAYSKALYTALYQLKQASETGHMSSEAWDRVEDLLAADRKVYHDVWSCECGHHRWDHDGDGHCNFLGCRKICG